MFWCKLFFLVSGLRLEFWNLRYTENDQKFYLWLWPRKFQFSVYMDTCETSDQSSCKNVYHNEWAVWFGGKTICAHHIDEFAIFAHKTGILMKCNTLIWSFIKYKHSNVYDFVCKVNVWDTNLAQATSPISDSRTDVPEKSFWVISAHRQGNIHYWYWKHINYQIISYKMEWYGYIELFSTLNYHYCDVIMGATASQISLMIV